MEAVRIREELMEIPTYGIGEGQKNPLFLEKRVYQGSSGRVYPLEVIDRVEDEARPRTWRMVILENEWLEVWIMPELGGRVQRARSKVDGRDFVYHNSVVKPALVGLAGPWISGGIEFNWPQHHRPSTFLPLEHALEGHPDGSKSVLVAETDRMNGTRCATRFRLLPGKAYLRIEASLYNRTERPQTFLWWANPALAVDGESQSVFPPDVHAVMDHGRRDVSAFPLARGSYYKTDYTAGVDISRWRNIPVPTSYMAHRSDYDFVGHYNHGTRSGMLHVADHRVSPGKKQWTWGTGDFGQAWERELTDADGPYIELMTGVFTDNQPDFTWMAPYEEKSFVQHFMPYRDIGLVTNATVDGAVSLSLEGGLLRAGLYVTAPRAGLSLSVRGSAGSYADLVVDLDPRAGWTGEFPCAEPLAALSIEARDAGGGLLVAWRPGPADLAESALPEPARPIPPPGELVDAEALWLAGRHLEQYRHATREAGDYYREGLFRAPGDARLNTALGLLLLGRGELAVAEGHFRRAIVTLTRHNGNPAEGEAHFHLGTALRLQGRHGEAEDAFAKAAWTAAWQGAASLELARASLRRRDFAEAATRARAAVDREARSLKARHLLAAALRLGSRAAEARRVVRESLEADALDAGALREAELLGMDRPGALAAALRGEPRNLALLAGDYADAGLDAEALACLDDFMDAPPGAGSGRAFGADPLLRYLRASLLRRLGRGAEAAAERAAGAALGPDRVFPNRLEELLLLEETIALEPADWKARHYRGNLLYDRRRHAEAARDWEAARQLAPSFPTARRNLALAYFNKEGRAGDALAELDAAFRLDPTDARVLLELDQLRKRLGEPPASRLAALEGHPGLVASRDDLSVELATLRNVAGRHEEALALCLGRRFHPWEGGEGKVTRQYAEALLSLALRAARDGDPVLAESLARRALESPENLGEGRLPGTGDNELHWCLGRALQRQGSTAEARVSWERAAAGDIAPSGSMFYNDQPPERIFYQGLALRALGEDGAAARRFSSLADWARTHAAERQEIDFFAVSLPDFLIFDDDLDRRHRVHCGFMLGLGLWGLGDRRGALAAWEEALAGDPAHQGLILGRVRALAGDFDD